MVIHAACFCSEHSKVAKANLAMPPFDKLKGAGFGTAQLKGAGFDAVQHLRASFGAAPDLNVFSARRKEPRWAVPRLPARRATI